MEHLLDFTITKVYEPQKDNKPIKGTGEYGDWQLFTFYTDKTGKEKFSFMWGEKKPRPTEGLKIKHMEYEEEKRGEYTNLNVKKIEVDPASKPEAIPNTKEDLGPIPQAKNDREVSFYVAYAKDIMVALIQAKPSLVEDLSELKTICSQVAKAGVKLMNESLNNGQISSQESLEGSPVEDKGNDKGNAPQQEEDRKLRAKLKEYAKKDNKLYFETLGIHRAEKAEEVIEFAKEAQDSLLRDLEKAFEEPPF